jgi:hypothetical protein
LCAAFDDVPVVVCTYDWCSFEWRRELSDPRLERERVARIGAAMVVGDADPHQSLCATAARIVGVTGAGVVLISGGRALGNVCVSDAVAEAVEEVQYTLGEGPCVDACHTKQPVLVSDLAATDIVRWPGFREGAQAMGVRAAFGFPLLVQRVCIGALNLYNDRVGDLSAEQFADALVVAQHASQMVLGWQSVAGPGSLAWQLEQVPVHRAVVHQAAGKVSVQARIPVNDALVLMRAYAFAEDMPISDVAAAVVGRRLRFDADGSTS